MEIKAADVMKLRKMTGAGMMDCKKALQEAEGDYERAKDIIREKGKLVVSKRADRTATEGVVVSKVVGQKAYLLCLACETDFVAQNAEYSASAEAMLEVAVKNDVADLAALLATKNDELTYTSTRSWVRFSVSTRRCPRRLHTPLPCRLRLWRRFRSTLPTARLTWWLTRRLLPLSR